MNYLKNGRIDKSKGVELNFKDGDPQGVFTLSCYILPGKDNPSAQEQQIHTTVHTLPGDDLQREFQQKGIYPTYSLRR